MHQQKYVRDCCGLKFGHCGPCGGGPHAGYGFGTIAVLYAEHSEQTVVK